jgi:hypothetical protein
MEKGIVSSPMGRSIDEHAAETNDEFLRTRSLENDCGREKNWRWVPYLPGRQ